MNSKRTFHNYPKIPFFSGKKTQKDFSRTPPFAGVRREILLLSYYLFTFSKQIADRIPEGILAWLRVISFL